MSFDIGAVLGAQVSKLDTQNQLSIEMIDLDLIDTNEENFYELSNLEPLMDSIAMDGLQQPLVVTTNPADPAHVLLISGHRRRAAISALVKLDENAEHLNLRSVPCVRKSYSSPSMAKLQLILANSTARTLTSAEVMHQAHELEMVFHQLESEGFKFPGRMRDKVAAACKVAASRIGRLNVIRKGLIPEYMEQFKEEKLSEDAAYVLAGLTADQQEQLLRAHKKEVYARHAKSYKDAIQQGYDYDLTLICPSGKPCSHKNGFIRHDAEEWLNPCGGEKCCLDCRKATTDYTACPFACASAKKKRSEILSDAKAKRDAEIATETKKRKKRESEMDSAATTIIENMKAMTDGLTKKEVKRALGNTGYDYRSPLEFICGELPKGGHQGVARNYMPNVWQLISFCKATGCSADFILGLSGEAVCEGAEIQDGRNRRASEPELITSHSEREIYDACIEMMQEVYAQMIDFMEFCEFDFSRNITEENCPIFRLNESEIVSHLFLRGTTHSGGTSTRQKCKELGLTSDGVWFEPSEEDDDLEVEG